MTGFSTDADRRVIPRWRTFDETLRLGELGSVTKAQRHQLEVSDFLTSKISEWRRHRTVGHASDLVGAAVTLRRESESVDAAQFLLREDISVSPWVRELAEQVQFTQSERATGLHPEAVGESILRAQVRTLRNLLRTEPQDPITWVDLARAYTCLGQREQASRSMIVAQQLGGENRFVLRSAGRFWVSQDDPERAHSLFARSERTRHDPWLLAAEIAIGSIGGRSSRLARVGQNMLAVDRFLPSQMSELASAVATLELVNGGAKKSRRLFQQSLIDPTENSIAQAAWASRQHSGIKFDLDLLNRPNTFEAKSWTFFQRGDWGRAVDYCRFWMFDQPFSSRPSIQGSFLAAIALEDYGTSEYFARQGLLANPDDSTLLNNWAFALINQQEYTQARSALTRMRRTQLSERDRVILGATGGLLEFRAGNIEEGRLLYEDALSVATNAEDTERATMLALATAFHAIEEASILTPASSVEEIRTLLARALQMVKRAPPPLSFLLKEKLTRIEQSLNLEATDNNDTC